MAANRNTTNSAKSKVSAKAPRKPAAAGTARKKAAAGTRDASSVKPAKKKAAAGTRRASSAKPAKKKAAAATRDASSAKPAKKKTAAATKRASSPVKALKGIKGGKSARIAQIVAESFLAKPGPSAPAAAAASTAPVPAGVPADDALRTARRAATELFAKKAEDVVLMDLRNLSTVADYYLIATCRNEPQMRAILGGMQRALSREGMKALRSEYMPGVRWAVLDYGDLIVHLFEKQTRGFYSLERLWADAPSTTLRAEDYVKDADDEAASTDGAHYDDDL